MQHVDIRPNDFERIFLRHEIGHEDKMIFGMRIDIFMHELVLNHTFPNDDGYDGEEYPHQLLTIDIENNKEKIITDNNLTGDSKYGDRFHILHGYRHKKVFDKHFFVTRAARTNNVTVYDEQFNDEFGFAKNSIAFIDSDANKNVVAFISRKSDHPIVVPEKPVDSSVMDMDTFVGITAIDELYVMNQYDADIQNFYKLCRTTERTDMVSVACGDDFVYLLEHHKFDRGEIHDDFYSIYTIEPNTGKRVGRADLALFSGKTSVVKDDESNTSYEYFEDNLTGGYGKSYYGDDSKYQPHDYHNKKNIVKVGSRTSCNTAMPCSQFLEGKAIIERLEREELFITVLGIDSIGGTKLAVSYITYGGGYLNDCDTNTHALGKPFYNIDIIDMSHRVEEFAYDTLDLAAFNRDYHNECEGVLHWEIDFPFATSGKLVTCTENYIAVPLMLKPIDFDNTPHVESVIALFDRTTNEYISYIKLGKDYHVEHSTEVLHPNPPIVCTDDDEDEEETIHIKMDVIILDIDSDCSQIAVSYVMRYTEGASIAYNENSPIQPGEFQIYTEVFKDLKSDSVCQKRIVPFCEKAENRDWKVGTNRDNV